MTPSKIIKHHSNIISIINNFKKPKWSKLTSKSSSLSGAKAYFKPLKNEFKIEFNHDSFRPKRSIDIGKTHKNVLINFSKSVFVLETIFLNHQTSFKTSGTIDKIHSKGFSEKSNYHYRLVIPLERDITFHYNIDQTHFTTDLGYQSRSATKVTIENETFEICVIHSKNKEYFLVIDSSIKQAFKDFSEKTNAIKIGFGYLTGNYPGNQGYFFAYSSNKIITPKHFRFVQSRSSIKSSYVPVHSNAYGYAHITKLVKKYYKLLRPVSLNEFSLLCERINTIPEFASALMLILESSIASLLFLPGGYAIALETLSDIIIGNSKVNTSPIKSKKTSKEIRSAFKQIIDKYSGSISGEDFKSLSIRVDQFNQSTNKARLRAPFEILKINLTTQDLEALETRNDFLHGRVPDILKVGKKRSAERINKDLFYSGLKFYTLINVLILKWVGYDNYVVNYPKIYEVSTQVKLKEEPYRNV